MFDKFVPLTREQLVAELKSLADKEELVDQSVFDDLMESVQHYHMAIATNYDDDKETIRFIIEKRKREIDKELGK